MSRMMASVGNFLLLLPIASWLVTGNTHRHRHLVHTHIGKGIQVRTQTNMCHTYRYIVTHSHKVSLTHTVSHAHTYRYTGTCTHTVSHTYSYRYTRAHTHILYHMCMQSQVFQHSYTQS